MGLICSRATANIADAAGKDANSIPIGARPGQIHVKTYFSYVDDQKLIVVSYDLVQFMRQSNCTLGDALLKKRCCHKLLLFLPKTIHILSVPRSIYREVNSLKTLGFNVEAGKGSTYYQTVMGCSAPGQQDEISKFPLRLSTLTLPGIYLEKVINAKQKKNSPNPLFHLRNV
jgi:hypothetical protein